MSLLEGMGKGKGDTLKGEVVPLREGRDGVPLLPSSLLRVPGSLQRVPPGPPLDFGLTAG